MLTIKNLSKTYNNGVQALNNINLSIDAGMFGLLGPNGAGKSSLMRTIATLQAPSSGDILFNDIDVLKQPELLRPMLGYLPQYFGVYPNVLAKDLLKHFALLKGLANKTEREQQINALLNLTNLAQHQNIAVSSYSGGMKQRFGIALALLGSPKLIIVDEPTAGLDPQERNRFHNLLSEVSESTVVILSTHIVEDVANLCPNMAIQINGSIVSHNSPKQLIENLNGQLWQKLIHKSELQHYQDNHTVISQNLVAGQLEIHLMSPEQPDPSCKPINGNLEDVYFSAMHQASLNGAA